MGRVFLMTYIDRWESYMETSDTWRPCRAYPLVLETAQEYSRYIGAQSITLKSDMTLSCVCACAHLYVCVSVCICAYNVCVSVCVCPGKLAYVYF